MVHDATGRLPDVANVYERSARQAVACLAVLRLSSVSGPVRDFGHLRGLQHRQVVCAIAVPIYALTVVGVIACLQQLWKHRPNSGWSFTVQKKTFTYEFEDNSPRSVTYEVEETERLTTSVQDGVPFVFANRAGMLTLAKPDVLTLLRDEGSES